MSAMQAVGWALVHSLWQGALAATVLAALLAILPARAARARYALAVATLVLMLALPLRTALRLRDAAPGTADPPWISAVVARTPARALVPGVGAAVEPQRGASLGVAPASATQPVVVRVRAAFEPALPWVVALWFCGVLLLSLRLASGWLTAQRLGTVGTRPAPLACVEALGRLTARLRITRPVRVLESAVVQVPAVIGWLRPVVLVPVSALTGLTPLQLDALLAHELAHVRRYDYVVNLVQSVIETVLFYHPAVWWVSGRVRDEREHCCDDLAVKVCGDAYVYATALVGMEGLRVPAPAFAVAAGGGSLMSRIRRLVAPPTAELVPRSIAGLAAVTLALTIGGGAGLAGATAAMQEPAAQPASGVAAPFARNSSPSSTDSLLAWVRSFRGAEARREAVKLLGKQGDPRALAALIEIARNHRDEDVQREAVENLGRLRDGSGLRAVIDFARTHRNPDVRREAVEAIREGATRDVALELLPEIARRDRDTDVQREAVEALGKLHDPRAFAPLVEFARNHPASDVRRDAVEALGKLDGPDTLAALLEAIAREGYDTDVQREAVETLGELRDRSALEQIKHLARTHPSSDVRRKAIDNYAEAVAPEAALTFLRDVLATDRSPEAQAEALEELADLPGGVGIPALIDAARAHPSRDVRAEARRQLDDSGDPRARDLLEQTPRQP